MPQEIVDFLKSCIRSDRSRGDKEAVKLAVSSLIGEPPNAFRPEHVATMLGIRLRTSITWVNWSVED